MQLQTTLLILTRNLATDDVKKVSLTNRGGLPPIVAEVVESKGIVIGYSNDLGMEVNINCTDPSGQHMVTNQASFSVERLCPPRFILLSSQS